MNEPLSPQRAARLLRAKSNELEANARAYLDRPGIVGLRAETLGQVVADIALVAGLMADHIERTTLDGEPPDALDPNWFPEGAVGKLTGLPLSKFATAEMIAKARAAGFSTLWSYVEHLEAEVRYWGWPSGERGGYSSGSRSVNVEDLAPPPPGPPPGSTAWSLPSEMRTVEVWRGTGTPVLLDRFYYNPQIGWPAPNMEWFDDRLPLTFIDVGPTESLNRQYEALPPNEPGELWTMDAELRQRLDAARWAGGAP